MGNRRMISKTVTQTQRFLQLPLESQALYFHLIQNSDDDGIVEAFPVVRMIGASEDNIKLLEAKGFVTPLNDEMVYFVNDFHEQNLVRKDRYSPSVYRHLLEKNIGLPLVNQMATTGQPNISKYNISKDNLSKDNLNQDNSVKDNNNYYTLDTTVNHNSEVNYNTIPTWLNDNSIKQLKKGNPNNLTFRIPIAYLNQLTGSNYYYIDGNINLIKDLVNQGYTVEDFKQVIEFKVYTWFNDYETRKYLTPSVLFEPTNFERYLEEAQKAPNNYSDMEDDLPF